MRGGGKADHPGLEAEPVQYQNIGVGERFGVGRSRLEGMPIAVWPDQRLHIRETARDLARHVAENAEACHDLQMFGLWGFGRRGHDACQHQGERGAERFHICHGNLHQLWKCARGK